MGPRQTATISFSNIVGPSREPALHHFATNGPPNEASNPYLGCGKQVTIELASHGLADAGTVHIPESLLVEWANPNFARAVEIALEQPPTQCPKTAALLCILGQASLLKTTCKPPKAKAFVKWKNECKCSLIPSMANFNVSCSYKAPPFKLSSLRGLAHMLSDLDAPASACKLEDINNCY